MTVGTCFVETLTRSGAHGTSTAGVAAGYACGGNEGVAPAARVLFMDVSGGGDYLDVPQSWQRPFQVAFEHNMSMHSPSGRPGN